MKITDILLEAIQRTGKGSTAVVGWGRGMGHKGHMFLASAVITKAKEIGADPYFVVSRTVGIDDPIKPEEKLAIYKKVFPSSSNIFQVATDEMPDLTRVLSNLNKQGYKNVVVVVGADQVNSLSYVKNYNNKPNKAGDVPYAFDSLEVIARQEVASDPGSKEEGPRATPMRQVLLDPSKTDAEKFAVWRAAMNPELSDDEVRDLMNKAEQRMKTDFASKAKKTKKESIDFEEAKRKKSKRRVNPYYGYYWGGTNDSGESSADAGAGESMGEAWSNKYKRSIDCNNPKGFSQRAHCQGRKKNEDYHPNDKPPGPETKPTMPKGSVKVDVSDVYDWYKLGMHISDLKGLGKHDFGQGPPSTMFSFGSEEEEHKYIKALYKTGLTTTDIDPIDPKKPKGLPKQKTDPRFNTTENFAGRKVRQSGRKTKSSSINENSPPHGTPQDELKMMIAGTKPAWTFMDIEGGSYDMKVIGPLIKKYKWEVVKFQLPGHDVDLYVVAQQGDKQRAQKIADLILAANTGKIEIGADYHRELGTLLGYPKDRVDNFVKRFEIKETSVNEVADQPYRYMLAKRTDTGNWYIFQTDSGNRMVVSATLDPEDDGTYSSEIAFGEHSSGSMELTGKGDAFRIFATVGAVVKEYLRTVKPYANITKLKFSGKTKEPSRIKLYDTIAKNIGKFLPDFKFAGSAGSGNEKFYHFTKDTKTDEDLEETLKKVKGKWALVSRHKPEKVLQYYHGSGHPSKEWVSKVERRIHSFSESKGVVKSVMVGNFRHDLIDHGWGWQVRIYNGNELYDSGLTKNTLEKGLAALDNAVAYTKKQLRITEAVEDTVKPRVYLDMDGVLADFFGEWAKLDGKNHYKDIGDTEKTLQMVREHPTFWVDLPVLPGAKELIATVIKNYGEYRICTKPLDGDPRCKPGKLEWIKKHLSDMPPAEILIESDKSKFAMSNGNPNILVDDYGKNIDAWRGAGGIALQYSESAHGKILQLLEKLKK